MYFTYNVFRTNIFDTPWLAICQCYLKLIVRLTRCDANLSYTMGWWVNNGTLTTKLIINYQPFAYLSCNKYPKIQSTILHTLHRVHLGKVIHICYYSSSKISKSDLHYGRDNIFVFFSSLSSLPFANALFCASSDIITFFFNCHLLFSSLILLSASDKLMWLYRWTNNDFLHATHTPKTISCWTRFVDSSTRCVHSPSMVHMVTFEYFSDGFSEYIKLSSPNAQYRLDSSNISLGQ